MRQSVSEGQGEGFARHEGLVISNFRQKGRAQREEGKGGGKGEEVEG